MTKAIVSSAQLYRKLKELKWAEIYIFSFNKYGLSINEIDICCECSGVYSHAVLYDRVNKLEQVLRLLNEQPITIAVDEDGWLYIKEAIM